MRRNRHQRMAQPVHHGAPSRTSAALATEVTSHAAAHIRPQLVGCTQYSTKTADRAAAQPVIPAGFSLCPILEPTQVLRGATGLRGASQRRGTAQDPAGSLAELGGGSRSRDKSVGIFMDGGSYQMAGTAVGASDKRAVPPVVGLQRSRHLGKGEERLTTPSGTSLPLATLRSLQGQVVNLVPHPC